MYQPSVFLLIVVRVSFLPNEKYKQEAGLRAYFPLRLFFQGKVTTLIPFLLGNIAELLDEINSCILMKVCESYMEINTVDHNSVCTGRKKNKVHESRYTVIHI